MHRRVPRGDLLDLLIEARDAGERLSEDELLAACILFLFAGHEASAQLVANGLLALAEDEAAYAWLRAGAVALADGGGGAAALHQPAADRIPLCARGGPLGGTTIRQGQTVGLRPRRRQPRSGRFPRARPARSRPRGRASARVRRRHPQLHRRTTRPARGGADAFALLALPLGKTPGYTSRTAATGSIVRGLARLVSGALSLRFSLDLCTSLVSTSALRASGRGETMVGAECG